MTSTSLRPALAVGLAALLIGFVACNSRTSPSASSQATPAPAVTGTTKPASTKLFADWPAPAGALVITGEQLGYLEPCGCTAGQVGGLGRRYDLLERLRAQGWPLAAIDLGSLAEPPPPRGGPAEGKIKFTTALRALSLLKYDALTLGPDDLKLGIFETLGQLLNVVQQNPKPVIVAGNVVPDAAFQALFQPSLRTTAGPIKVGITAALDPAAYDALADPDKSLLKVSDPVPALRAVLADLEKDTNVQVLMVQGPPSKAKELAQALPGFDLVIGTSEMVDPEPEPTKLNDGNTLLIQVGKKGKYVGVVGFYQDPKQKFRYGRQSLNQRFASSPEPMRKLIEDDFHDELKQFQVVEDYPKHDYIGGAPGATFIGAQACQACHPNTYQKWVSTKHAQAYEKLADKGPTRKFDADCISCHATGFEYTSGFRSAELTPNLKGNQCENCHGPASKHAAEPDNKEFSGLLAQAVTNPEKNRLCYRCHDEDNSPKFDFAVYHGKMVHLKLDKYDDPAVHKGITPVARGGVETRPQ
jgi:hypothetical protein